MQSRQPTLLRLASGFVTDFLDTLGVLVAALLVRSLPLNVLQSVVVVVYAASMMLRSAITDRRAVLAPAETLVPPSVPATV